MTTPSDQAPEGPAEAPSSPDPATGSSTPAAEAPEAAAGTAGPAEAAGPPQTEETPGNTAADAPAGSLISRLPGIIATRTRAHLQRDWPGWLTMGIALTLYLITGFGAPVGRDPGVYIYAGERVADGVAPYLGIMNRAGPLAHFVPGIAVWFGDLVGADPVRAVRFLFMLLSVASIGATYFVAKQLWKSRAAGTVAALALLSFHGFAFHATSGPREKTFMVLCILVVLLAIRKQAWLVGGFATALATLTWQPSFAAGLFGLLVAIAFGVPGFGAKVKAAIRVAIGGAIPTAVVVGAYAAIGHLQEFLDGFVLINARYTKQPGPFEHLAAVKDHLVAGYGVTLWVIAAGFIAHAVAGAIALIGSDRTKADQAAILGSTGVMVGALGWSAFDFQSWPDLFVALPSAAVGFGWLIGSWEPRLATQAKAVALAASITLVAISANYSISHAGNTGLARQEAITDAVFSNLPADATVVSFNAPHWLSVADVPSQTKIQMFGAGFPDYYNANLHNGLEGYALRVKRMHPDLLVITFVNELRKPWMAPLLQHYKQVGSTAGTKWYVSPSIPIETRTALRQAIRVASGRDPVPTTSTGGAN